MNFMLDQILALVRKLDGATGEDAPSKRLLAFTWLLS
jgi:hypothetical protein